LRDVDPRQMDVMGERFERLGRGLRENGVNFDLFYMNEEEEEEEWKFAIER